MKQSIAATCLLALCATGSHAQSSVTLFGTVDQFLSFSKSGPTSRTRLEDGGNTASRFAFSGSEDLGGGLRANFLLEAGFSPDTGLGTLPGPAISFSRQSFVGLSGPWGRVDAGRMYTPMFYTLLRADPFGVNSLFSPLNLVAATDAQNGLQAFAARASNMVRYRSPKGPLLVDIAYAAGEASAPDRSSGSMYGGNIGWNQGPFYVSYGFQKARSGTAAAPVASPAASTYQALSTSYEVTDAIRVSANFMRNSSSLANVPRADLWNLGASWVRGPVRFMAGVIRREVERSPRSQLGWTLGADYFLSKRTALYTRLLHLSNDGGSAATLAGVPVAANSGNGVQSLAFGVRHNF